MEVRARRRTGRVLRTVVVGTFALAYGIVPAGAHNEPGPSTETLAASSAASSPTDESQGAAEPVDHRGADRTPRTEAAGLTGRVRAAIARNVRSTFAGKQVVASVSTDPGDVGSWTPVMPWPLVGINASLLPSGKVLLFSTSSDDTHTDTTAALYDPPSDTITSADASLGFNIFCGGFAKLVNGTLFVAGGNKNPQQDGLDRTAMFDGTSWTETARMAYERWYPSVTPLPNGETLITGGGPSVPEVRGTSGQIRQLTGAAQPFWANREYPFFVTAPNGKAQYLGPKDQLGQITTAGTGSFTNQGARDGLERDYGSFALYRPDKVLISGGGHWDESAVVVDLPTGTVAATSPMAFQRRQHNLTVLADGTVFANGGFGRSDEHYVDYGNSVVAGEIWNPTTGLWSTMASEERPRQYHSTAILLPDGRVLTAGGGICGPCALVNYAEYNAQIFSPPYLFKHDGSGDLADRPTITATPPQLAYARTFGIATPEAATITGVALARLGSVTHSTDMEHRYIPLTFTKRSSMIIATSPSGVNVAPPGYYQVLLVNADGVPSLGKILRIGTQPANVAPTVAVTSPSAAATQIGGATVTVQATASDSDSLVATVEFFDGTTSLGVDDTAPYIATFTAVAGNHPIKAIATDDAGARTTSATVNVNATSRAFIATPAAPPPGHPRSVAPPATGSSIPGRPR